jgi:hypothetical protein
MSPGPKMLAGRMQHVRRSLIPLAFITNFSASAFVCAYASGNCPYKNILSENTFLRYFNI